MKPFAQSEIPPAEVEKVVADVVKKWNDGDPEIRGYFAGFTSATTVEKRMRRELEENNRTQLVFLNDKYQVVMRRTALGDMVHLSIKRLDRQPLHDWRDLQEIKNQLVGPECEAVELYPAESRKVDSANQYHLWCFVSETYRFPFGFNERLVSESSVAGSVNRPFGEES